VLPTVVFYWYLLASAMAGLPHVDRPHQLQGASSKMAPRPVKCRRREEGSGFHF